MNTYVREFVSGQPIIRVTCERCEYKSPHRLTDAQSYEGIGLWWKCLHCGISVELSTHTASLCERIE